MIINCKKCRVVYDTQDYLKCPKCGNKHIYYNFKHLR